MDLSGKTAVVTGGAVRVGRAIALGLAEAGVDVAVHYCHSAEAAEETVDEIRSRGVRGIGIRADFSTGKPAADEVIGRAVEEFGRVEMLINNAAIFEAGTLSEVTDEQWERHFSINLKAPLFLCRSFARQLTPDRRGHIVNIADWRGTRYDPAYLVYGLTKGGLIKLTRDLAVGLAPNIQVNAVAPGAVLPPPGKDDRFLERLAAQIPLQRAGSTADVTDAVLYLLNSDFITGEVIHVAGGQQLYTQGPRRAK